MTWQHPEIEHNKLTKWHWLVSWPNRLKLGYGVDIGEFTYIQARYGVYIADFAKIGGGCMIYSKNTENGTQGEIRIGYGVKIGAQSLILPGSVIPSNTTIKAHSIVKKNFETGKTEIYEMVRKLRYA